MKILITGVTGSGKTSVAKELRKLGYTAHDGDKRTSLGRWVNESGKTIKVPPRLTKDWIRRHRWDWDPERLNKMLAEHTDVFICGTSSNQHELYHLFDLIFLLSISRETMLKRLNTRASGFGKFKQEQAMALEWHRGYDDFHSQFGSIKIDANQPLSAVVKDILAQVDL